MTDTSSWWRERPHPMDNPKRYPEARVPAQIGDTWYHDEVLNLREFAFSRVFPSGLLDKRIEMDPGHEYELEHCVIGRITSTMLGKQIPPHVVTESRDFFVDVFDSPWQHFKANHADSWWLGWLVRRRPVATHKARHTATLTTTWDQFVGFPWQSFVSHLDPYQDRFGPAVRFTTASSNMVVHPAA